MKRCLNCSAELNDNAKFCHVCGEKVNSRCFKCGAELEGGAEYCSACGANLKYAEGGSFEEEHKSLYSFGTCAFSWIYFLFACETSVIISRLILYGFSFLFFLKFKGIVVLAIMAAVVTYIFMFLRACNKRMIYIGLKSEEICPSKDFFRYKVLTLLGLFNSILWVIGSQDYYEAFCYSYGILFYAAFLYVVCKAKK